MTADQRKVRAEQREAWWARWWEADYSWEGLAKKRWRGWSVLEDGMPIKTIAAPKSARDATLQDFWRAEAEHLISEPGSRRRWTRAHVPLRWESGRSAKAGWSTRDLEGIATAVERAVNRLPAGAFEPPSPTSSRKSTALPGPHTVTRYGSSWGAPLHGAILFDLPETIENLKFIQGYRTAFLREFSPDEEIDAIDLRYCLVEWPVFWNFSANDVRFTGTVFLYDFEMHNTYVTRILCQRSIFCGDFELSRCSSERSANFSQSKFFGTCTIDQLKTADFSAVDVYFYSDTMLTDLHAVKADLSESVFAKKISLDSSKFGFVEFDDSHFLGPASFQECALGTVSFPRTIWKSSANFSETSMSDPNFDGALFEQSVDFREAEFLGTVSFSRVNFTGPACFADTQWPSAANAFEGAFREAKFASFADFRIAQFVAFAAFDGATVAGEARFSRQTFEKDKGLSVALNLAVSDESMECLEHGFRALRNSATDYGDIGSAQRFYRYELIVRRKQATTRKGEKFVSWFYGITSDYGFSISRPAWIFLSIIAASSLMYFLLALLANPNMAKELGVSWRLHPATIEAVQLSVRSMFNLFGIWSSRPVATPPDSDIKLENLLLWNSAAVGLAARLISTAQSLAAGVLVFLMALAVRRRFQIN